MERRRRRPPRLLCAEELPDWYPPRRYIHRSYRPPFLVEEDENDSAAAAASASEEGAAAAGEAAHTPSSWLLLWRQSNETGNILTHLLGGFVWIYFCRQSIHSEDLIVRADRWTFWLHVHCYALCSLMPFASTLAHLLHCVAPDLYRVCWSFDHVGIMALWLARALCEGYVLVGFCRWHWWQLWAVCSGVVFSVAGFFIVSRENSLLLLPLYAFIHLPIVSAATLDLGFWGNSQLQDGVFLTLLGSSCGVIGYMVMQAKVPERFFPGKLDLLFHSHQWWHIFTIVGPILCLQGGRNILGARLSGNSCAVVTRSAFSDLLAGGGSD